MPASAPNLPTNHTGKLFGIVYITLTGVIDTIIPAASPWSWVGKSTSYLLKLAPLMWWALPTKTRPKLPLKTTGQLPKTGSLTAMTYMDNNGLKYIPSNSINLLGFNDFDTQPSDPPSLAETFSGKPKSLNQGPETLGCFFIFWGY
ncbi:hypothetical protein DSO57_1029205 [Entomophthora muscae]|uniref:Uncharacterized protein n=1 Tax=Entomophthora muscae TaxID=34485 RepID=A0ACC2SQ68_9FUNG|nr:hypothetical protein DSO57_1029205 [Entomophthora muscae]